MNSWDVCLFRLSPAGPRHRPLAPAHIPKACIFIGDDSREENVYEVALFSNSAGKWLLNVGARPPWQVIAHGIDRHGRKHQKHGAPETPISMRTYPVRTMFVRNTVAILLCVLVVTVLILTHGFPASSIPCRMISGRRCYCPDASTSRYESPASLSSAGQYPLNPPRVYLLSC